MPPWRVKVNKNHTSIEGHVLIRDYKNKYYVIIPNSPRENSFNVGLSFFDPVERSLSGM